MSSFIIREDLLQIPPTSPSPWLVYTHGNAKSKRIQTFTTLTPNISYIKCIPSLQGKRIQHVSSFGWLILRHNVHLDKFYLWDPVTSNLIDLPPVNSPDFYSSVPHPSFILTNNPTNKNNDNHNPCFVLVICQRFLFSYCLNQGSNNDWVSQRLDLQVEGSEVNIEQAVVSTNGKIYAIAFIANNFFVVTLEIRVKEDEDKIVPSISLGPLHMPLPFPNSSCARGNISFIFYLVESCGMVYIIMALISNCNEYRRIHAINIYQLDWETMTCVEVDSLDDRAFFLDKRHGSTWCWANNGGGVGVGVEPNSVYFLVVEPDVVYHYRLLDHSLTPLCLTPDLVNTPYYPTWVIMPHHQRKPPTPLNNDEEGNNKVVNFGDDGIEYKTTFTYDLTMTLHEDLVAKISKYLHWNDYLSLRATCKSLQSQLPLFQWRADNSLPLFLFSNNIEGGLYQIMDPRKNDSRSISIPIPSKFTDYIDYSKNGWLLFDVGKESFHYYNLFTGVRGEFPPFEDSKELTKVGFSSSPTSSDCLTFGILIGYGALNIAYHCNGGETWDIVCFEGDDEEPDFGCARPGFSNLVFLDGGCYFLYLNACLGFFKLEQEEPTFKFYTKKPKLEDSYYESNHLVECNGELLSVFIGHMGMWVQVFRFNPTNHKWIELKSLGNNILFIDENNSFSVVAQEAEMKDRIYLTRLYGDEIVFYSLVTCKFHTSGSKHSMDNLYGTRRPLRRCWV